LAQEMDILNRAETPPFMLDEDDVNEERRLQYRYVDLRRPVMQQRLRLRHQIIAALRRYLDGQGFIDVETPILTKPTPERRARLPGAKPHPSRQVLRPASVTAAVQAAADDVGV